MSRCLLHLLALCCAFWAAAPTAAGSQEQRLFWSRFAVDAEVTELVLHGAGREAWTTTWRPAAGELGARERWLPIALGSDFELQMGAPVRADAGPGIARFLEWAPALPEFARGVPLEVWSRALPRDAAVARGWSLPAGLGLTAVGWALLALGARRRPTTREPSGPAASHARRAALGALLLGGGAALFTALRLDGAPAARPWVVHELSGPQGGPRAPESAADPRGIQQTCARDALVWEPSAVDAGPPALVLRTEPPGALLRLTSVDGTGWRIASEGNALALAEAARMGPLSAPAVGPQPLSPDLWGPFSEGLVRPPSEWRPGPLQSEQGPAWAFWGRIVGGHPLSEGTLEAPAWLVGGLPSGRETLLICDPQRRLALRWIGLDG
ncbi:MAG: hypothetical protein ACYS26_14575 [Planctomycetota bacterium]